MPLPNCWCLHQQHCFFFSHYCHICDFAPALILASLLCLGKKQVWHSYCTEVLLGPREWVCNDVATLAQNSDHVPAQSKVCLEATCSEVSASSTDTLMEMGSQDWISAILRISFVLMYFPEIFFNS